LKNKGFSFIKDDIAFVLNCGAGGWRGLFGSTVWKWRRVTQSQRGKEHFY